MTQLGAWDLTTCVFESVGKPRNEPRRYDIEVRSCLPPIGTYVEGCKRECSAQRCSREPLW